MRAKIAQIISDTIVLANPPLSDQRLIDNLGADSLDMIEIAMKVEETFSIQIADDAWAKVKTVGDVYALVEGLINANQG